MLVLARQAQSHKSHRKKPSSQQAVKDNEEMYVPPVRINMNIRRHQDRLPLQRLSLIDMSANKNMLSHQTWCKLGKSNLESTTKFVLKSANVFGDYLGAIEIILEISNHSEKAKFFVMAPGNLHEEVLLSRTWMAKRNCTIGWTHRHMSFLNANQAITVVILAQGIKESSLEILEYRKSLQKNPIITTTSTSMDKDKAKTELNSPTLCHDLITQVKKEQATSSSTTKNEMPQGGYQRRKVYQPKYPSLRAQQRRNKQVLVSKHMVQAQKLCDGDSHRWVERTTAGTNKSSGWLTTRMNLEAQGYNKGNRELWLPKPEFISYKVPSKTTTPKGGQPKKRATSKIYKDWIVPHNLSSAQGYYDGQTQLWVPKNAIHKQEGSSSLHEL